MQLSQAFAALSALILSVQQQAITVNSRIQIRERQQPTVSTTPSPTATPSPTFTITPTPSVSLSPTMSISPTASITPTPANEIQSFIMNEINNYRKSLGLSEVQTDPYTCDFAKVRAKEISTSFNHNGFSQRVNSKTMPYPSYSSLTENIAMNSNYKDVVKRWIASPGHAENMRADTPFVCVEKYLNYYAYEGWKP